jgi:hypothetical protein
VSEYFYVRITKLGAENQKNSRYEYFEDTEESGKPLRKIGKPLKKLESH